MDEDSFSLLFRGSLRTPISQDVYAVRHPALGTMRVLLVRVLNEDQKSAYYEVIFEIDGKDVEVEVLADGKLKPMDK